MTTTRQDFTLSSNYTTMTRTAFDYDKQQWVRGDDALQLLRKQCRETLDLLQGAKGEEYARFMGRNHGDFLTETLAYAKTLF